MCVRRNMLRFGNPRFPVQARLVLVQLAARGDLALRTTSMQATVALHVRIFTHRKTVEEDHAFLINSMPGGTSDRLEQFKVDEKTTFRRLRRLVELTEDRGMMRRTPLFQELLFAMVNSPNPHEYGKDQRFKYRFGVFDEEGKGNIPALIPLEEEQADTPVLRYYCKNTARQDLIIVPATQISPSGLCSPAPEQTRCMTIDR